MAEIVPPTAASNDPLQQYFSICDRYRCSPHAPVALALKYPTTSYLTLEKNFGQLDLLPLCEVLANNTTITSLDFRRCKIGSPGCFALRALLETNRTIRQLSLCGNDIGEHGCQALIEGLSRNSTLEKLYLKGNRVGKLGAAAIADLIRDTSTIKLIDLTNNNIGRDGVLMIANALNERYRHRASARATARRQGVFHGEGGIRVRDVEVVLDGNLVREEVTSSILHGTGLVFCLCGAIPLIRAAQESQDKLHMWGVVVYLLALLGMYSSATLGHSFFMYRRTANVFRMIDHSAIYFLIAGTYTPFMLVNLRNKFAGSMLLVAIWALAIGGAMFSTFLAGKYRHWRLHLAAVIGWLAIIGYRTFVQCIHQNGVLLLSAGGVVYTIGGYLYIRKQGDEDISHGAYVCALLGTALHYFAVYFYVQPSECTDDTLFFTTWLTSFVK